MRLRALLLSFSMLMTMGGSLPPAATQSARMSAGSLITQSLTYEYVNNSAITLDNTQSEPTPAGTDDPEKNETENNSASSGRQYGEEHNSIKIQDGLHCDITYPVIGLTAIDAQISDWVDSLYDSAVRQLDSFKLVSPDAWASLTIDYNAYRGSDRIVSVELLGEFTYTGLEYPIEIIKVINIDIGRGRAFGLSDLISEDDKAQLLELLKRKLLLSNPLLEQYLQQINDTWLSTIVITPDGAECLLSCGNYLPYNFGTQRVFLTDDLWFFTLPTQEYFEPRTGLDPDKPMVALTFDDGPCENTQKILDLLDQYGCKASFCIVGNRIDKFPEVVLSVVAQGSEIVSHSWAHSDLTTLSESALLEDINNTQEALFNCAGVKALMTRAPYGSYNKAVKSTMAQIDMPLLQWSVDSLDWKTRDAQSTYDIIMSNVKDGSVILCHDLWAETGDAMEIVIPELINRGYQLVTISELMAYKDIELEAGLVYSSAY